jgi:hypothetical protein
MSAERATASSEILFRHPEVAPSLPSPASGGGLGWGPSKGNGPELFDGFWQQPGRTSFEGRYAATSG